LDPTEIIKQTKQIKMKIEQLEPKTDESEIRAASCVSKGVKRADQSGRRFDD
jgi:hypothetical protein